MRRLGRDDVFYGQVEFQEFILLLGKDHILIMINLIRKSEMNRRRFFFVFFLYGSRSLNEIAIFFGMSHGRETTVFGDIETLAEGAKALVIVMQGAYIV